MNRVLERLRGLPDPWSQTGRLTLPAASESTALVLLEVLERCLDARTAMPEVATDSIDPQDLEWWSMVYIGLARIAPTFDALDRDEVLEAWRKESRPGASMAYVDYWIFTLVTSHIGSLSTWAARHHRLDCAASLGAGIERLLTPRITELPALLVNKLIGAIASLQKREALDFFRTVSQDERLDASIRENAKQYVDHWQDA